VNELQIHNWLVLLMFALAAQTFMLLLWVNAPYGRVVAHFSPISRWHFLLRDRLAPESRRVVLPFLL